MAGLEGRAALITGASGGIGSCIARRLAESGVRLALCGRDAEKLQRTADSLPRGAEALLLQGDAAVSRGRWTARATVRVVNASGKPVAVTAGACHTC